MTTKIESIKITCVKCKKFIKLLLETEASRKIAIKRRRPTVKDKINRFWRVHKKKCNDFMRIQYI